MWETDGQVKNTSQGNSVSPGPNVLGKPFFETLFGKCVTVTSQVAYE